MSRKLSKKALTFARIWGDVKSLPDDDWNALVELRTGLTRERGEEPKERKTRKPRGGAPEGGAG